MGIGGGGYGYGGSYQGGYGQPMMRGGFGGMRGGMGRGFGSVVNPMMMRGGFSPGMVRSDKHHALIPELSALHCAKDCFKEEAAKFDKSLQIANSSKVQDNVYL